MAKLINDKFELRLQETKLETDFCFLELSELDPRLIDLIQDYRDDGQQDAIIVERNGMKVHKKSNLHLQNLPYKVTE